MTARDCREATGRGRSSPGRHRPRSPRTADPGHVAYTATCVSSPATRPSAAPAGPSLSDSTLCESLPMAEAFASRVRGGPRPAVFLPGAGWYGDAGRPVAEAIEATHTTYLLDLPGMGRSPGVEVKVSSLRDVAPWLAAFLDSAHIDRADIIGHSLGGGVGLAFA